MTLRQELAELAQRSESPEVEEGAPVVLVERIAYAKAGQPAEYARDLIRGDRARVVVWTSELRDR